MSFLSQRRKQQLFDLLLANLVLVGTFVAAVPAAMFVNSLSQSSIVVSTVPLLFGSLVITMGACYFSARTNWASLGVDYKSTRDVFTGLFFGAAGCSLIIVLMVLAQWATWMPIDLESVHFDFRTAPFTGVMILVVGAIGEELFLRGLVLQLLARAVGPVAAVGVTSIVFALLHGSNPNVTPTATLNTALYGALFGLVVFRQRSLWMAIGVHLGWNLAQVTLGANNSGITIRLTELNLEPRMADWLTGGVYGLEGGVLATCMALLLAAAIWLLPQRADSAAMLWEQKAAGSPNDVEATGSLPDYQPDNGVHTNSKREG